MSIQKHKQEKMKGSSLSRWVEGHVSEWDTAGPKSTQVLGKIERDLSLPSLWLVLLQPSDVLARPFHSVQAIYPTKDLCSQPAYCICYNYVKFTMRVCKQLLTFLYTKSHGEPLPLQVQACSTYIPRSNDTMFPHSHRSLYVPKWFSALQSCLYSC